MKVLEKFLTSTVARLVRFLLGIYFRRIELFHPERVPPRVPVLFASNHPGSITDSFIIGALVPRQVHFVATVQLFRFKPLAWLLKHCGIIPVNRLKDDPRAMRSVLDTFEACFKVLEQNGAVGIFPEGITYDDSQLKTVKTGAARMALELEHRHAGQLGLEIVPVGLTYSAKERYRSEALVHFGEPIRVARFVGNYDTRRKECIHELNSEIERRLQSLIVHLPKLEQARVVEAVKQLYLERLKLGSRVVKEPMTPRAEELVLTQAIVKAVEYASGSHPERLVAFVRLLNRYEHWRDRLRLSDAAVERVESRTTLAIRSFASAAIAVIGFPMAAFGWLHRLPPALLVNWAVNHLTDAPVRKAQTAHVSMLAGLAGFGGFYALYIAVIQHWFGWPISLWYAVSLPVTGLAAHYYFREFRRLGEHVRTALVLLRAPVAVRRLEKMHARLLGEIEALRHDYRQTLTADTRESPTGTVQRSDI
jgi:1-acyl-sn-glycerol-3-phosphate acyltransferase